jgi:hypothetical protein
MNNFMRFVSLCFMFIMTASPVWFVYGEQESVEPMNTHDGECHSNLLTNNELFTQIPNYEEQQLQSFGCSTEMLDAWLSPDFVLKGYHVVCIAPPSSSSSSSSSDADAEHHVMKMLVFKQGQPEDTVELTYDLSKLERANYHALRKELSRDIGIAREVDKWHDAGC